MSMVFDTNKFHSIKDNLSDVVVSQQVQQEIKNREKIRLLPSALQIEAEATVPDRYCLNKLAELEIANTMRYEGRNLPIDMRRKIKSFVDAGNVQGGWEVMSDALRKRGISVRDWQGQESSMLNDCSLLKVMEREPNRVLVTADKNLLSLCKDEFGESRCKTTLALNI